MKAKIDYEIVGKRKVVGVRVAIKGRLRGMSRKRKRVVQYGKQLQQNRVSRISYGAGVIYTKYGTIGVKVQSVSERGRKELGERISKVKE